MTTRSEQHSAGEALPAPVARALPSFREVYTAHLGTVWRVLRSLGVRDADLEDVCQETFLVVHRRLPEFDGRCATTSWLYAICVRTAAAYRRRAWRRREEPVEQVPERGVEPTQSDELERRRAADALASILDGLDDDKRAVFVLYEIEQQPMAEVALALSCPVQTAYSRLHAARREVDAAVQRLQRRRQAP